MGQRTSLPAKSVIESEQFIFCLALGLMRSLLFGSGFLF
jgi:hypothetical protein